MEAHPETIRLSNRRRMIKARRGSDNSSNDWQHNQLH